MENNCGVFDVKKWVVMKFLELDLTFKKILDDG